MFQGLNCKVEIYPLYLLLDFIQPDIGICFGIGIGIGGDKFVDKGSDKV